MSIKTTEPALVRNGDPSDLSFSTDSNTRNFNEKIKQITDNIDEIHNAIVKLKNQSDSLSL